MVMRAEHLLPRIAVRDTSPATKRKAIKVPTMGTNGSSRYSDRVVAGVLYDLKRKTLVQVAIEWNIDPQTIGRWYRGINRKHVTPAEWPANESKRQDT